MKRKTDFEAVRENSGSLFFSLLCIAFGAALPYIVTYLSPSGISSPKDPSLLLFTIPFFIVFSGNLGIINLWLPLPAGLSAGVYIAGLVFIALGLLFFALFRWAMDRNHKLREARDKRIEKKYGKKTR